MVTHDGDWAAPPKGEEKLDWVQCIKYRRLAANFQIGPLFKDLKMYIYAYTRVVLVTTRCALHVFICLYKSWKSIIALERLIQQVEKLPSPMASQLVDKSIILPLFSRNSAAYNGGSENTRASRDRSRKSKRANQPFNWKENTRTRRQLCRRY